MSSAFFNIPEFPLDIYTFIVHTTYIDGHKYRRSYVEKYYP